MVSIMKSVDVTLAWHLCSNVIGHINLLVVDVTVDVKSVTNFLAQALGV